MSLIWDLFGLNMCVCVRSGAAAGCMKQGVPFFLHLPAILANENVFWCGSGSLSMVFFFCFACGVRVCECFIVMK